MRRKKLSSGYSGKLFTKTAQYINKKNLSARPMRGGIRL
jgi:hypothetical protein